MSDAPQIEYPSLVTAALRSVVAKILQRVSEEGLPGSHFFYVTFRTDQEGVEMPAHLRARHPEEITVVLQNEFWDLYADDERFVVNLRFDGVPHRIVVPWGAVTAFVDPSVDFALRFAPEGRDAEDESPGDRRGNADREPSRRIKHRERQPDPDGEGARDTEVGAEAGDGGTVVQIDTFRKG